MCPSRLRVGWTPATARLCWMDAQRTGQLAQLCPAVLTHLGAPKVLILILGDMGVERQQNALVKSGLWCQFVSKPDIAIYLLYICYILALLSLFNHG